MSGEGEFVSEVPRSPLLRLVWKNPAPPPPRKPLDLASAIERRIAGGEAAEAFLCVECWCWMLEPAYCLCRERALW